jgi:propanediol dehydratase small subunit
MKDHPAHGRAVAEERAVAIDRENAPPFLVRHVNGTNRVASDSRRADEDVKPTELGVGSGDGDFGILRSGHVAANRENVLVKSVGIDVEHGHPCAARAQQLDGRCADPAGASCDEGHAAAEVVCVHTQSYIAAARTKCGTGTKLGPVAFDPIADYPLGTQRPDLIRTPGGLGLEELTLDALRSGRLDASEMRATAETLELQAEVALAAGRAQLAANLERAAELTGVPDEVILEVYTALRPHRSTADELERWADRLEEEFQATLTAAFVREAGAVYAKRNLLLPDEPAV